MAFDIAAAKKAGYSDAEIADHLAQTSKFDTAAARKAGYTDAEIVQHLQPDAPKGTGSKAVDSANAVGTGFNRGLLRIAGMPVDAASNILDLGKAALGAPYTAITGKAPPEFLQLADRKGVIGSSDYLIDKAGKTKVGNLLVNPANPDYEGGYLQNAGGALTSISSPRSVAQGVNQMLIGQAGAAAGKATADATDNPALAITANMLPGAAQSAATGAVKRLVRGGEEGRQQMAQRIQDLKNGGIDEPTLGLASGNQTIGGVENLLQSTPGAMGVMKAARDKALTGMANKAGSAAETASPNRGADVAGTAIQNDLKGSFLDRMSAGREKLYGRLDQLISGQTPIDVTNTDSALNRLTSTIPGAEQTSKAFINGRIANIKKGLDADTGSQKSAFAGVGGAVDPTPQIPYEAAKKLRSSVGAELSNGSLAPDVPTQQWKQLYAGLSEDMKGAAAQAGPQATQAWDRANDFTRAGIARTERVQPFANKEAPEQAFTSLVNSTKENNSTLQAVKKSVTPETRASIAGTVIDRLGKANPGNQNDIGDVFSQERFLTNWNTMTPKARMELFSGFKNAEQVAADVDAIAKSASMMRDNSKLWANPSGTSANMAARGVIGALGAGGAGAAAGLVNPLVPIGAAAGVGGVNLLARKLTSPEVVRSMAERNYLSPEMQDAQIRSLIGAGRLSDKPN